jgi:hypothetical protein
MTSSSAQTWPTAVMEPWPSSTFPIISVTVPSLLMLIHELSIGWSSRSPGSSGPAAAAAWAKAALGSMKETAR